MRARRRSPNWLSAGDLRESKGPLFRRILMAANIDRQPAWGLVPLRLVVGIVFIAHSWIKFHMMGIAGTTKFMGGLGIPMPNVAAVCIIALEAIGGLALILGVGTRLFAPLLAMDMLGAI